VYLLAPVLQIVSFKLGRTLCCVLFLLSEHVGRQFQFFFPLNYVTNTFLCGLTIVGSFEAVVPNALPPLYSVIQESRG
jgi:hypothetical protein